MPSFGENLKAVRKKNGLTQSELAKKINEKFKTMTFSRAMIANWETNRDLPLSEKIIVICNYFRIGLSELFPSDHAFEVKDTIQESIIKSACNYFSITEEILITDTTFLGAYRRSCVFFLVRNNTQLTIDFIGTRLKKARTAVRSGIENIECRKKHDKKVKADIEKIESEAIVLLECEQHSHSNKKVTNPIETSRSKNLFS